MVSFSATTVHLINLDTLSNTVQISASCPHQYVFIPLYLLFFSFLRLSNIILLFKEALLEEIHIWP